MRASKKVSGGSLSRLLPLIVRANVPRAILHRNPAAWLPLSPGGSSACRMQSACAQLERRLCPARSKKQLQRHNRLTKRLVRSKSKPVARSESTPQRLEKCMSALACMTCVIVRDSVAGGVQHS